LFEEEHSKEGHEDHHAVRKQGGGSLTINGSESGSVTEVNASFITFSLLLVGIVFGGDLLKGVFFNTILLELLVTFVKISDSLVLVFLHHTDLEHTFGQVLDLDSLTGITVDEFEFEDLIGGSILKFGVRLIDSSDRSVGWLGSGWLGGVNLGTVVVVRTSLGNWEFLDVVLLVGVKDDGEGFDSVEWHTFVEHLLVDLDSHLVFLRWKFLPVVVGLVTSGSGVDGSTGVSWSSVS